MPCNNNDTPQLLAISLSDDKYNSNDDTHLTTRTGTHYRTNGIQSANRHDQITLRECD